VEPTFYRETPVRNYHYPLRINPEERYYQLLHGGILKTRMNKLNKKQS
jgi:hypothetical protein